MDRLLTGCFAPQWGRLFRSRLFLRATAPGNTRLPNRSDRFYVGGSSVEAWMSEEALAAFPDRHSQTARRLFDYQKARDGLPAMAEHAPKLAAWKPGGSSQ